MVVWRLEDYDGYTRPWLSVYQIESETTGRPGWIVERFYPTWRWTISAAFWLSLGGAILGAGATIGSSVIRELLRG